MDKLKNPTLEDWFDVWCEELIDTGYIQQVIKTEDLPKMVLSDKVYVEEEYEKVLYKGTKRESIQKRTRKKVRLEGITYRPDRLIIWAPKAKGLFHIPIEEDSVDNSLFLSHKKGDLVYTPIEVKAPPGYGGRNTSDASFAVKQKWVWAVHKILVQKVYLYPLKSGKKIKDYLWLNTFTPTRYLWTDGLTTKRTISKWKVVTFEEYTKKAL